MQVTQLTFDGMLQNTPEEDTEVEPTSTMSKMIDTVQPETSESKSSSSVESSVPEPSVAETKKADKDSKNKSSGKETKKDESASEKKQRKTALERITENHSLIDGKTNEEAIQTLLDHLDTAKEVQNTSNMAAVNLPPGLFVSYTISGTSFATSRENETDYIEKIKMALPRKLRGANGKLRSAIDRELDNYSIRVFTGIRYVPAKNFAAVQKILSDAQTKGIGKDNKYSIKNIIDELWENKDEINETAQKLGISAHISNRKSLEDKIYLTTFFIDTSIGSTELSPEIVDRVVETKTKQVVDQINTNLTNDLQDIISKISKILAKAKDTKSGKPHGKSISALKKEIKRVRSLNLTKNPEVSTLLDAADGLILRSLDEAKQTSTNSKSKKTSRRSKKAADRSKKTNSKNTELPAEKDEKTPVQEEQKSVEETKENASLEDILLGSL